MSAPDTPRVTPAAVAPLVAAASSVGAAPMMDRRSQDMGPPIADIRPTMTMNTPRAGPMAVTRPMRKAFLGISGSMRHSLVALLAARMNSTACTAAMITVKLQRNHMIGRLEICK